MVVCTRKVFSAKPHCAQKKNKNGFGKMNMVSKAPATTSGTKPTNILELSTYYRRFFKMFPNVFSQVRNEMSWKGDSQQTEAKK